MMSRKAALAALGFAGVVLGCVAGLKLATDDELRGRLIREAKDAYSMSRSRMDEMTEEVAVRTAKMTKNPKINQEWVENQWEKIGY